MARYDIKIDPKHGELIIDHHINKSQEIYVAKYLDTLSIDSTYYEVTVPTDIIDRISAYSGIIVKIPYVGNPQSAFIRLKINNNYESPEYYLNGSGSEWYKLKSPITEKPLYANQLYTINPEHLFFLQVTSEGINVYSGYDSDLLIRPAIWQNEVLLLKASPGNLYQFPTTGVGLINYLHSNLSQAKLSRKLQDEFTADNVTINNASINENTGELILDLTENG